MKTESELYKKMYYHLFNKVTDVIDICNDRTAKNLLVKAQQETEEIYISADEENTTEKHSD